MIASIDVPLEVQMDAALTADLRAEFAKDRMPEAVALADQILADQKEGHHEINWAADPMSTLVPWLDETRLVAKMLRYRARLQAQDGDLDGALRSARAILGTERSLCDDPLVVDMLVRMALQALAIGSMERTLAQGVPSPEALKATQLMLEDEAAEPMLQRAMRGERASNAGVCEWLLYGGGSIADLGEPRRSSGGTLESLRTFGQKRMAKRAYPVFLRTMNECLELTRLPIEQQVPAFAQMEQKMDGLHGQNKLLDLLLPALVKAVQLNQRNQARLRTAITALAAERFRQEHKRWPRSLEDLTDGKYLSSVPSDPYDGHALRIKEVPDWWIVYSLGPDETDNGGFLNRINPVANGSDLGFQLWNPERRRQPPAELLPAPAEQFNPAFPGIDQPGLPPGGIR